MLNKRLYAKTPTKVFPTAKIKERKRILKERLERRKKEKNYWPWYYSGEIFFMAADLIRDDKEWVLVLYLFNMMDKDNTPRYRTFITKDDYITQDLRQN